MAQHRRDPDEGTTMSVADETFKSRNVALGIVTAVLTCFLVANLRRPVSTTLSAIDAVDHLVAFEDPSVQLLPLTAVQKSLLYDLQRDGIDKFRRVMNRRYESNVQAEKETGGLIDLAKSGLERKTRDDVVEWHYLRNHRQRPGGPAPMKWAAYTTHPMLASKRFCGEESGKQTFGEWRMPFAPPTFTDEITPYSLIRGRIAVSNLGENDERFLTRPTLMCVSLLSKPSRLSFALHQYGLWGRYCDDFWIIVPRLPSDVIAGSDYETGFTLENAKSEARSVGMDPDKVKLVDVSVVLQLKEMQDEAPFEASSVNDQAEATNDDATGPTKAGVSYAAYRDGQRRRSKWQIFRETIRLIDGTSRSQFFEHFFFADESVYAIPENLFSLLSEPQVTLLHQLGTPLWLGNRMTLPPQQGGEGIIKGALHGGTKRVVTSRAKPAGMENLVDLAAAAGVSTLDGTTDLSTVPEGVVAYAYGSSFVLNMGALRLLAARLTLEECMPHASLAAVDVALALCLAPVGVYPRDTSDENGSDRFLVHSVYALARQANSASSTIGSWYAAHRPRAMPQGLAVMSPYTVSIPMLTSVEDMSTIHAWIHHRDGARWLLS